MYNDIDKIALCDRLIEQTRDLGIQHNKLLSYSEAWSIVQDIVINNYPKCCVKYVTGQRWRV